LERHSDLEEENQNFKDKCVQTEIQKKESFKLRRQQKRFDEMDEDHKLKAQFKANYGDQSHEQKEEYESRRKQIKVENDAQYYSSRSEEQIEQYRINREVEIEKNTEERQAELKQVIYLFLKICFFFILSYFLKDKRCKSYQKSGFAREKTRVSPH
jgi:hypothetical protein